MLAHQFFYELSDGFSFAFGLDQHLECRLHEIGHGDSRGSVTPAIRINPIYETLSPNMPDISSPQ